MKRDRHIPDLITVTEAAEILDISRQAAHKRIDAGQLPGAQVGPQIVLRRALVESIALEEGSLLTWGDLALNLGLPVATGAEQVARAAGALTPHDPRTGRIPHPWTGRGMDHRLTRAQAEQIEAELRRTAHLLESGGTLPYVDSGETA